MGGCYCLSSDITTRAVTPPVPSFRLCMSIICAQKMLLSFCSHKIGVNVSQAILLKNALH